MRGLVSGVISKRRSAGKSVSMVTRAVMIGASDLVLTGLERHGARGSRSEGSRGRVPNGRRRVSVKAGVRWSQGESLCDGGG